jgi:hypothetical protein
MKRVRIKLNKIKDSDAIWVGNATKDRWGNRYDLPQSKFGNPYSVKKYGREECLRLYEEYITQGSGKHLLNDLHELEGKDIVCVCELSDSCHADILIKLSNNLKQTL